MRRLVMVVGVLIVSTAVACGGDGDGDDQVAAPSTPAASQSAPAGGATAAPTASATPLPGDPPGSPEAARLDQFVRDLPLPANVRMLGRRDLTNESESQGKPDLLQQFTDTGRLIGAQYIYAIDGEPRISLGINHYRTAAGALDQYARSGGGRTGLPGQFTVAGLGDTYTAATIQPAVTDPPTNAHNIVFVRGRYYVTLIDFVGPRPVTAELLTTIAKELDARLTASPER